jgi:beta-carotene ketolase (CrtW type)
MYQLRARDWRGFAWALFLLAAWSASLAGALGWDVRWQHPATYLWVLLQTHLYTGLFITAHDAMHGAVIRHRRLNAAIGWLCAGLFAFNHYGLLLRKHRLHHLHAGTEHDPDFHHGGFWPWYARFAWQYITWPQLLLMGLVFNGLIAVFPIENVWLYWALPSILATFQLFYFGTYLPHKGAPDNPHRARSQRLRHWWAFLSCYFFGYHYEHHAHPGAPWWRLPEVKEHALGREEQ